MVRTASPAFVLVSLVAAALQTPSTTPPTQAQQHPVFRGGTHFVRVDYLFELTVGANGATERHLLAIRIKP